MPSFIFVFLNKYIVFYPLVALVGLLLAGFNLPISEDLIIITGALLSQERPDLLVDTLVAIYIGAIVSDFFVYWVGTKVRKGASKTQFFLRVVPKKALDKMHYHLDRHGIFTFIVCRFIPFGVRNTLFFTAGFFNLSFRVFALYDIIAAMISINTLFFLTYHFGEAARRPIKIAGIVLFVLLISLLISLLIRLIVLLKKSKFLKKTAGEDNRQEDNRPEDNPLSSQ